MMAMKQQQELFDGFLRHRKCLKCRRKLHPDKQARFLCRLMGLCFLCLRSFHNSDRYTVEGFISDSENSKCPQEPSPSQLSPDSS